MITEAGHFALVLALCVAIVQVALPMIGAARDDSMLMAVARPAAVCQFALIAFAFACLTAAFVTSDFSVAVVVQNSHTAKPLLYKISGVWGNHEGSMLLWVLILSLFGAAVGRLRRQPAAQPAGPGIVHPGPHCRRLLSLHAVHLEPVRADGAGAA